MCIRHSRTVMHSAPAGAARRQCRREAGAEPMTTNHPLLGSHELHDRHILIVEDADVDRMLLEAYLRQKGAIVHLATNGLEGIRKAQTIRPDMILMDVRMPVCDGLSACRQLQADARTSDIPVIFLSGAVMPDERLE